SCVEWLGKVPAHWEVQRLKASVSNVVNPATNRGSGKMCLALEHVESWTGRIQSVAIDIGAGSQVKKFRSTDVLFGKLRPYLAKVSHPKRNGICVNEFLVLRSKTKEINTNYIFYLLRSKRTIDAINASTYGVKMPRAEWSFISGLKCPLPPSSEQVSITGYLDQETAKIDHVIVNIRYAIDLLKEFRTALISAAVTGKIDVRASSGETPKG
ncbi:MAG: restriction endonuclease subunit S, partial [Bryobacterales bacterium]|nr:restriction endonuclease subunit S [Bryobacterales bacterium]